MLVTGSGTAGRSTVAGSESSCRPASPIARTTTGVVVPAVPVIVQCVTSRFSQPAKTEPFTSTAYRLFSLPLKDGGSRATVAEPTPQVVACTFVGASGGGSRVRWVVSDGVVRLGESPIAVTTTFTAIASTLNEQVVAP